MFNLKAIKAKLDSVRNLKELFKVINPLFAEDDTKQVNVLLKELSSSSMMRSHSSKIVEIDRDFKKGGSGGKLSTEVAPIVKVQIRIPQPEVLTKNWKLLNENADKIEAVEYALAILNHTFRSDPDRPKLVKACTDKLKSLKTSKAAALKVLDRVGNKHIPASLKSLVSAIAPKIKTALRGQYTELQELVYVVPVDKDAQKVYGSLAFYYYLRLIGLKQEETSYEDYCIVFVGKVDEKEKMSIWVNTIPKFKLPTTFPLGVAINSESVTSVLSVIENLIGRDSVQTIINPLPIPTTRKDVKDSPLGSVTGVKSASVKDDVLSVKLKAGIEVTDVQAVYQRLAPVVKGLLGITSKGDEALKYRVIKKGKTIQQIDFMLHAPASASQLDLRQLMQLRELLALTDDEVDAIKSVLQRRV